MQTVHRKLDQLSVHAHLKFTCDKNLTLVIFVYTMMKLVPQTL